MDGRFLGRVHSVSAPPSSSSGPEPIKGRNRTHPTDLLNLWWSSSMAKQPDNRKGPDEDLKGPKQKGKPEPVEDDLEEIEEAAEIVEEPSTPPRKGVPNMSLEENLPQPNIVDEAKDVEEADEVIMAEARSDVPPAAAVVDDDLYAEEVPSGPGQKAVAKDALKAEAIENAEEVEEREEVGKAG